MDTQPSASWHCFGFNSGHPAAWYLEEKSTLWVRPATSHQCSMPCTSAGEEVEDSSAGAREGQHHASVPRHPRKGCSFASLGNTCAEGAAAASPLETSPHSAAGGAVAAGKHTGSIQRSTQEAHGLDTRCATSWAQLASQHCPPEAWPHPPVQYSREEPAPLHLTPKSQALNLGQTETSGLQDRLEDNQVDHLLTA